MVGEYPPVMASETDMDLPPGFQNGFDKYSNFRPMGRGEGPRSWPAVIPPWDARSR